MSEDTIQFTRNSSDQSTNQGFQFEFYCGRCGSGFRTRFKAYTMGSVTNALDTASSLFGGILGRAADESNRVSSAAYQKAHDQAFEEAMAELKPAFVQCPRCSNWVCRKSCWNQKRGLCKDCSPDLAVEVSAAQSSAAVQEIWAAPAMSKEDEQFVKGDLNETVRASCPECGAALATNAKFCPECGAKLNKAAFCPECGAKLQPGARFCGECGHKA
jgi:membrane protease subunit (stomatin/prohibitin family)